MLGQMYQSTGQYWFKAMSLTPLSRPSPLILLLSRVPESQKCSCPREGHILLGPGGQGTVREGELGLSSEGSDSIKKRKGPCQEVGQCGQVCGGGNMEGDKKKWNQGEEKDA